MRLRIAAVAFAASLGFPAAASADIFAVVEVAAPAPRTDTDIALINVGTGGKTPLPAGINTTVNELHPSITPDGRRLAFERRDPAAGTLRILLADLATGQSADLFNGFEAAADPPRSPAITSDGLKVATGAPFEHEAEAGATGAPGAFPRLVVTDAATFPAGPYARRRHALIFFPGSETGYTADPTFGGDNVAYRFVRGASPRGGIALDRFRGAGGITNDRISSSSLSYAHPSLASPGGVPTVLFDRRPMSDGGATLPGDIVFAGGTPGTLDDAAPIKLPAIVNSAQDESRPAFTSDGRYVVFVRRAASRERLYAWDSQTQTLVNAAGVDLGSIDLADLGNVSLYTRPVLDTSRVTSGGIVTFDPTIRTGIGILVQKVVGKRKLFGRTGPKLKLVGRVPLGTFAKGKGKVNWDLRVDGKKLKPGRYQVTVRAVTKKLAVRDFGRPRIIRVR